MKKLFFISLLQVSTVFSYSHLENQLFDAINDRNEDWAKELVNQIGPMSKDFKEAVTKEAEKTLKKYRKATTNIEHSYGDQWISRLGGTAIFFSALGFISAGFAAVGRSNPEAATLGILSGILATAGITAKVKAYYCVWAYRNLRQAQGVVGIIADAKVKEHEEKKHHEKHD